MATMTAASPGVDMTLVVNPITSQPSGWMYNCSLLQFLLNFDKSGERSRLQLPFS